jgi:hypothetical protein
MITRRDFIKMAECGERERGHRWHSRACYCNKGSIKETNIIDICLDCGFTKVRELTQSEGRKLSRAFRLARHA